MSSRTGGKTSIPEPDWIDGLVIYELATRGFTSPKGPESGTFASCAEKMPYLRDLGVTGIWLTGYNWADESHFYNIWTQYATMRPDVLDERLGGEDDFRRLVDTAHRYGIRVFLDVTTHGVMSSSPLIKEHPQWFSGGSWGMTDYDWYGDHEDLFRWWVDTWVGYVERFGVDGYRLDVSMYRPDLWQEIKRRAWELGHPIAVFHELGPGRRGVVDFLQWGMRLKFNTELLDLSKPFFTDLAGTIRREVENDLPEFEVSVELEGGTVVGTAKAEGASLRIVDRRKESRSVTNPRTGDEYGEDLAVLVVSGIPSGARIANVAAKMGAFYQWKHHGSLGVDFTLDYEQRGDDLVIRFPRRTPPREYLSLMLSCHDDGWEGFPPATNPYVARGSRFVFGYTALLAPAIPLFMSGEEFDADFVPLPRLSPHLFGGKEAGKGAWLYGSWLQWEQLRKPRHRDMLEDARDIIALRKRFSHLIRPFRRESPLTGFFQLSGHKPETLPVPYAYCDESSLLVVAGNPSRKEDTKIEIPLPWDRLPMRSAPTYVIRDVWSGSVATRKVAQRSSKLSLPIPRDGRRKGGLAVWEIRCGD